MADPTEPDADGPSEPIEAEDAVETDEAAEPVASTRRARSGLDGRTIAVAAVLGVAATLLTVLVLSAFTSSGSDDANQAMQLRDPDALLKEPLQQPDGGTTTLASFREDGRPMLVNLWQAACVPCVREMPMLDAAQADNPGITFVGINTQETAAKAEKLAKQTGITYPWVLDPDGEFYFDAGAQGMPTTLLLDASGAIISTKSGDFKDADELQTFLDQAS